MNIIVHQQDIHRLDVGNVICYTLLPSNNTTHSSTVWRGRITEVYHDLRGRVYCVRVVCMASEDGVGRTELVLVEQVTDSIRVMIIVLIILILLVMLVSIVL